MKRTNRRDVSAFTLIELLVVVAIIALLISILLPSLSAARESAKAVKCAANMKDVANAVALYLAENNGVYPPSYVYPTDYDGSWDLRQNDDSNPFGYVHWSWFLYNKGAVSDDLFGCPSYPNGGAPRTNPGDDPGDWEGGQVDDTGVQGSATGNSQLEDMQAPRVAYTANAAIIPRNKFTRTLSKGPRVNVFVRDNQINEPRGVILATEFINNWECLSEQRGSGIFLSKSHRSVNPFWSEGAGSSEYAVQENVPLAFRYGNGGADDNYGLLPIKQARQTPALFTQNSVLELNVVGRNHPGGDELGGTTNFMYTDGHVERKTVLSTMKEREWGMKYYSLSGFSEVFPLGD